MDNNITQKNKFKKYIGSFRLLVIQSNSKINKKLIKNKSIYEENKKEFHKKNLKLIYFVQDSYNFKIGLYGYDGKLKKIYNKINPSKIIKDIENMPMGKDEKKINDKKLSLYNDYHPKKSLTGTGFKDEETALKTIKLIKDKPKKYQFSVIQTMYNRAKYHPHQTNDMKKAMKIYKKWLNDYPNI